MHVPQLVDRHHLHEDKNPVMASVDGNSWTPCRCLSYDRGIVRNFVTRLKLAWLVFAGRADALTWRG